MFSFALASALLGILLLLGLVVWPDSALPNFLSDFIADRLQTSKYYFRAYTSNATPSATSVLTDFTEGTWSGYAPVAGSAMTWSAPNVASHIASSTATPINFNNTSAAAVTIYGIFVTDGPGPPTKLYFAERDPNSPISIPAGGTYQYTPNQQYKSIN